MKIGARWSVNPSTNRISVRNNPQRVDAIALTYMRSTRHFTRQRNHFSFFAVSIISHFISIQLFDSTSPVETVRQQQQQRRRRWKKKNVSKKVKTQHQNQMTSVACVCGIRKLLGCIRIEANAELWQFEWLFRLNFCYFGGLNEVTWNRVEITTDAIQSKYDAIEWMVFDLASNALEHDNDIAIASLNCWGVLSTELNMCFAREIIARSTPQATIKTRKHANSIILPVRSPGEQIKA